MRSRKNTNTATNGTMATCTIHKANPDYDMSERRYLYRLMLKGETAV
jgi:hypothetical protein